MNKLPGIIALAMTVAFVAGGLLVGTPDATAEELKAQVAMPKAYEGKHMPAGGWTDPKRIARGKEVFEGNVDQKIKCAKCHGIAGKPKAKGARDFRNKANMEKFSDTYWFFRISEGVPKTLMKGWKDKLSEDDMWSVMAYEHTFSNGGKPAEPDKSKWEAPKFK